MRDGGACIFCGIVAGTVPSTTIATTERAVAFMDINPVTPGHALVIPRRHSVDVLDTADADLASCVELARVIADRAVERLGADGINLLNCTRTSAGQTVFHTHFHVIPRYANDPDRDRIGLPWASSGGDAEEIARLGGLLS